jgi:hypothetical protein
VALSNATISKMATNSASQHAVAAFGRASSQDRAPGPMSLRVKECVPGAGFLARIGKLHTANVNRSEEVLELPWIKRLPGEKRIKVIHGQVFVMQYYLGCSVLRAHISYDEEQLTKE